MPQSEVPPLPPLTHPTTESNYATGTVPGRAAEHHSDIVTVTPPRALALCITLALQGVLWRMPSLGTAVGPSKG